jgi:hypothetical protein
MVDDREFAAALAHVLGPLYRLTLTDAKGATLATFGRFAGEPGPRSEELPLPQSSNVLILEVDRQALEAAHRVVHSLADTYETIVPHLEDALEQLITQAEVRLGKNAVDMSRKEKQQLVAFLDERGAFALRKAVEQVADSLSVSRFTVYNYLDSVRES